jgi:phosphoglycerol transferase
MKNRNYMGHTNVVILGDHLAMENPVSHKLLRARKRSIYNRFITEESLKKNRDEIYHFSIFPTLLHFMGFQFDQNRMGLGASGFGGLEGGNYLHQNNDDVVAAELAGFSKKYLEFWRVSD